MKNATLETLRPQLNGLEEGSAEWVAIADQIIELEKDMEEKTMTKITIAQLAEELFLAPKSLRKKLRDQKIEKPGKRWEWEPTDSTVELIRSWSNGMPAKLNDSKGADVPMETIEADIAMEEEMDEELEAFSEPQEVVHTLGAWTITINEEHGIMAQAGKDKTKWMVTPEDIRSSLPKKVKTFISLNMLKNVL